MSGHVWTPKLSDVDIEKVLLERNALREKVERLESIVQEIANLTMGTSFHNQEALAHALRLAQGFYVESDGEK